MSPMWSWVALSCLGLALSGCGDSSDGVGAALPRDRGPHWMTYFEVTDVDAAVARVDELGGHTLGPARDTPHGRTARVADPEGATFSVIHTAR